jgi:hypothetical protein
MPRLPTIRVTGSHTISVSWPVVELCLAAVLVIV